MSADGSASLGDSPGGRLTLVLGIVPGVATAPVLAASVLRGAVRPRVLAALMVPGGEGEARLHEALRAEGHDGPVTISGDIDEVLAAAPDAVLVEDLLELNPSGSRHVARHQDVVELLDRGIAVHAGVSVTQLRAARELMRRYTGILPRNTVPEDVVSRAGELELVDVPPAVLQERRAQGDRRLAATGTALFSAEALAALRAMALDITRRKVSLSLRAGETAENAGPENGSADASLSGRVLVLLADAAAPDRLVRAGHRLAEATTAPWAVAHVAADLPAHDTAAAPAAASQRQDSGETHRRDEEDALRLADALGAEIVSLAAADVVEGVMDYARAHGVTDIVVGRPPRGGLGRLLSRPLADRLTEAAGPIAVHMVGDARAASERVLLTWRIDQDRPWFHEYFVSAVAAVVAAGVVRLIQPLVPAQTLSVILLMAVLYSATAYGFAAALFTSVLSVGLYNIFFLPPVLEFKMAAAENVLLLAVFSLVGGITANLAGRLHDQAATAYRRERNTAALFRLAREVATAPTPGDVLKAVVHQLDEILGVRSSLYLPPPADRGRSPAHRTPQGASPVPAYPPRPPPAPRDREAIDWVHAQGRPAGPGTGTYEDATALYWPLRTPHGEIGVLALSGLTVEVSRQPQFRRRLESLSGLAAVAIERMMLSREIESARFTAQTESLRSALLSSISHDLRTPLASIIGSATSLLSFGRTYDEAVRQDLLRTILEEAERLNRFVGNLLQMTKLESGAITPKRQWIDVDDLVGTTLERMERRLQEHHVVTEIEPLLPPLNVDFVLMENVLTNLLDNAVKYSPAGSTITVRGHRRDGQVCLEVADEGVGIAPDDHAHVFDKFFRVYAKDSVVAGTGLGLAICKGIVETHGGTLDLESQGPDSREGARGTTFRILLPQQPLPEEYRSEGSENV